MSPFCASSAGGCHWIMISDSDLNRTNTYIHLPSLKKYFFNFNPPCRPHEPEGRPRGRLLRQHHPLGGQGGRSLANGVDGGDAEDVRGGGSVGIKKDNQPSPKNEIDFFKYFLQDSLPADSSSQRSTKVVYQQGASKREFCKIFFKKISDTENPTHKYILVLMSPQSNTIIRTVQN